jgi:hypothetical protein
MAEIKAKVLDAEEKSIQEKEQEVQKKSNFDEESGVYKVNLNELNKEKTDAVPEQSADEIPVRDESKTSEEIQKENVEEKTKEPSGKEEKKEEIETPIIEEVIENETDTANEKGMDGSNEVADTAPEQKEVLSEEKTQDPVVDYPENIIDLVKFMNETGGTLADYVRLNTDYKNVDENTLLVEYYKQTKPHLSYDEIQFLMEDKFSIDEESNSDKDVKRKKLALKEEVANAKNFLTGLKDKYYKEVKLGSKLAPEQQKAIEFFNRYTEEQKSADELLQKQTKHFQQETSKVFNKDFKGFNFNVGDKKYRFNVKDVNKVQETQSDLLKVFNKYVSEDKMLTDAQGYHKSLFAASNPDGIANHFYEQGKADAIKQMAAEAKNINMNPRKTADGYVETGGLKVKAISGDNNSGLKIKLKNY